VINITDTLINLFAIKGDSAVFRLFFWVKYCSMQLNPDNSIYYRGASPKIQSLYFGREIENKGWVSGGCR
jgi:hypothetical protein